MKKQFGIGLLMATMVAASVTAQEIEPLWEYLATGSNSPLPILKAQRNAAAQDTINGTALYDNYGGFKRYDASRLILGVRENGINESDPTHNAALAQQFPDRSLIWISPNDGSPQGVALTVGFAPVPLDQDFLDRGGTVADTFFNFDVAADGVIYVGYKNKILRYAPNGSGGFSAPTVAYTHPFDGSETWQQWRWENLRVTGSGANTVVLAGCKTWRTNMGYFYLTTTNGSTFQPSGTIPNGYGAASGGGSKPILNEFGEETVYVTTYPGSDNGIGTTFYLFFRTAGTSENFLVDNQLFIAEKIGDALPDEYRTEFVTDVDGHTDLDYLVAYSTPSWNTTAVGYAETRPGWLAVHDKDGFILSSYKLNILEGSELYTDGATAPGYALYGSVSVYIPEGASANSCEILWYSGIYGYGRYAIGNIPTDVNEWALF